jgi:predicted DNA-binding protein
MCGWALLGPAGPFCGFRSALVQSDSCLSTALERTQSECEAKLPELDKSITRHKSVLIDEAIERYAIKSVVDLGGCWAVNGGYTFHALKTGQLARAVLVDGNITRLTRERASAWPQLELIEAALGDLETVKRVGEVDAAIMFDILLHQVSPDWDKLLERYSHIETLIINNQNWIGAKTVRFPDFSVEEFISRVYHTDSVKVREWYQRHDEFNENQGKPERDVHHFWQWGITQSDLVRVLWNLGYRVDYLFSKGVFDPRFPEIEVVAIIARKRDLPRPITEFPATSLAAAPCAAPAAPAQAPPQADVGGRRQQASLPRRAIRRVGRRFRPSRRFRRLT